jgi:UDP-N-acetylmuramate dehydrogenase
VSVELARYTTLGTGGPARDFARPSSIAELEQVLARDEPVAVVGLGSNLLVADDGVDALVLRLQGELAAPCAIPGTVGGGVKMNAGAYGGDFASVLQRVLVASADGTGWLTPGELGLSYRHSELRPGQVVVEAELLLHARPSDEIKADVRDLNARRKAAQPTNRRTFGSVFKNPDHELTAGRMLDACGLKGHRIGGAQISPKHANFIENAGGARTEDALELMREAIRRAREQFGVELQHEVQLLGDISL